jgi:hypothetical protein
MSEATCELCHGRGWAFATEQSQGSRVCASFSGPFFGNIVSNVAANWITANLPPVLGGQVSDDALQS